MDPDNFKQAWQTQASQSCLTIDVEPLLKEVRRNQRYFAAIIFWRDVREVGMSLLLVPLFIYLGVKLSLPWTWYLTVPALVWFAGFMFADRMRHRRQPPEPGEPLRQHVESSLAQVEHQIWLLRNVFWWGLLPAGLSVVALFGQVAWLTRSGGWPMALVIAGLAAVAVSILAYLYSLNQNAVHSELEPRREELEALLLSLNDETAAASS
jgi:hypothetical protein